MLLARMADGQPEIFASIQGEGVSTGVPSVFVRLAECPLRCTWCDTKYTWDWDHYDKAKETVTVDDASLGEHILQTAGDGTRNVVITGGEPMLQQAHLVRVARELRERGFGIEVETAGVIEPSSEFSPHVTQWNVSPKLENSGNKKTARLRTGPLTVFAGDARAQFKFVVTNDADLAEVDAIVAQFAIPPARVTIMPEGTDAATLTSRARALVDPVRTRGYRLGTRMHVLLWGAERGR